MYLKGVGIVYPDFTFLSRKTKQEIYWEHDGRMDDPSYVRNAVRKMHANEKNDIYPGERRRDMEKNDFEMDTLKERKRDFFKGIRGWMSLGIFLTGLLTFGGGDRYYSPGNSNGNRETSDGSFRNRILYILIVLIAFILLVKTMVDEQPFSTTLTRGFSFIGILFMLVSVLIPRMGGYRSSGIELCSYGFFVLCDGVYLIPGILLIVLGRIIRAGFTCKESWIKYCRRDGCGDYITFGSRDG